MALRMRRLPLLLLPLVCAASIGGELCGRPSTDGARCTRHAEADADAGVDRRPLSGDAWGCHSWGLPGAAILRGGGHDDIEETGVDATAAAAGESESQEAAKPSAKAHKKKTRAATSQQDRTAELELIRQYQAQSEKYALKRGTRTTGAGASWRNPSIFSVAATANDEPFYSSGWTAAALAGDLMSRRSRESKSHKSRKDHVDGNPMLGRVWAGKSDRGTLVLKFPGDGASEATLVELSASSGARGKVHARCISGAAAQSALQFVPIEGIYGVYDLPCSGPHAVLITESEAIYKSPSPAALHEGTKQSDATRPLLELRRVRSLEIVSLRPTSGGKGECTMPLPSEEQLAEEARQLRLLRRSFKEHDFYFAVANDADGKNGVVRDATHSLQRSFLESKAEKTLEKGGNNHRRWWVPYVEGEKGGTNDWRGSALDSRFFWNEKPALALLPPPAEPISLSLHERLLDHVVPVTSAFVGVRRDVPIPAASSAASSASRKETYDQVLISRRSKHRTGTRFTRRGADGTGAVANYAETEQICFVKGLDGTNDDDNGDGTVREVYSHVQTRGSIPLHWSSPAYVTEYRPRVYVGVDPVAQARGLRDHLLGELVRYSAPSTPSSGGLSGKRQPRIRAVGDGKADGAEAKVAMVNLIDKHGDQGRLGKAFDSVLAAVMELYQGDNGKESGMSVEPSLRPGSIEHIWYDFHAECKGGRWDRLSQLLERVSPALDKQGYFCAVRACDGSGWEMRRLQDGVVRTNCMDCLDRTNVVQSMFGRYALYRQLHERLGMSRRRRTLPLECVVAHKQQPLALPWTEGEAAHRHLWADNADAISRLYAGTPALKGDFTRTGQRTRRGALDDGVNSLQRYYLNNFIDADRQEGMDLLVGSAEFNVVPTDADDESSRVFMLQELENSSKRRGYDETHARIKVESGQTLFNGGGSVEEQMTPKLSLRWLPGDLRRYMKSEALRSRSPMSSAAEEEDIDAPKSSDFLLQVTSSAAGEEEPLGGDGSPWWVCRQESDESDSDLDGSPSLRAGTSIQLRARNTLGFARKRAVAASLLLLTKAPILSAMVVVAVIASGFSPSSVDGGQES